MKKNYTTMLCLGAVAAMAATADAQQLPGVGFDQWKTQCGSTEQLASRGGIVTMPAGMRLRPGVEPEDWMGSSVHQVYKFAGEKSVQLELVTKSEAEGNVFASLKSQKAAVMGIGAVAPGFLNFGTPWVYAESTISNCDGGVYGGMPFTYRPDALSLDVKRIDSNDEASTVLAYSWTGTFKSKIGKKGDPTEVRDDVDRAVLGTEGTVLESGSNGELVGKAEHTFTTTGGNWETITVPMNYVSDKTPEKLNVVICCGNYYDRASLKENTELHVDNVKFVYYSRLSSFSYMGTEVDGFDPDTYEYNLDCYLSDAAVMPEFTVKGNQATASVVTDAAANIMTVKVSNVGEDTDGLKEHTYTFRFKAYEAVSYPGFITITMGDNNIATNQAATVQITKTGDNLCTFLLPDFTIEDLGTLGDIRVDNVKMAEADGITTYTGEVKGMQLLGGAITANVKINGTITAAGKADMAIAVEWDNDGSIIPINVTFTSDKVFAASEYPGFITIEMNETNIAENQEAKIIITPTSETECTFLLPDFTIEDLGTLGDIKVEGVEMSEGSEVTTYTGEVKGMQLLGGAIIADVKINGTITSAGKVDMAIAVEWDNGGAMIPINVTFTSDRVETSISIIEQPEDTAAEYYDIRGIRVNADKLPAGIYIRRQGDKTTKIVIR